MTDATTSLTVDLGDRSYPIIVGHDILDSLTGEISKVVKGRKAGLVSDKNVWDLYGSKVSNILKAAGMNVNAVVLEPGEGNKTLDSVSGILDALLEARLDRQSVIVALGGGVVGDMAGFAAAILLRGIPFIQIPTTIVAQVDSSVGGKTGVDHPMGKNLIGAFHQPSLVYIDTATLKTLPAREVNAGLGEVVKHAVIRDNELFAHLEEHIESYRDMTADGENWNWLISRNCRIKSRVVAADEREHGVRAILNYGHTAGHAMETLGGFDRFLHGEAVLFGMQVEAQLAVRRNLMSDEEYNRQIRLVAHLTGEMDTPWDFSARDIWEAMKSDKKVLGATIRFAVPKSIGDATVLSDVEFEEFSAAWECAGEKGNVS